MSLAMKSYPLLQPDEFNEACQAFARQFRDAGIRNGKWEELDVLSIKQDAIVEAVKHENLACHSVYIRIVRGLRGSSIGEPCGNHDAGDFRSEVPDVDEVQAQDQAELNKQSLNGPDPVTRPLVEYNILLSPTYQTPVLYCIHSNSSSRSQVSLDKFYSEVVPADWYQRTRDLGILGAISLGEHPITSFPAFYVHPCNTAEAMQELAGGIHVDTQNYLQIWLGLVGKCVGLEIPVR